MCQSITQQFISYTLTYIEYTNVSVYNTTIYFIYFKIVHRQGSALTMYYFKVYEINCCVID